MNNDDDIFLKKMKGVIPIKKNNKVKKEELIKNHKFVNKKKSKHTNTKSHNPDKKIKNSEFNLEKMDLRKGIRKGSLNIDKKIDFHGKTLIESEERFNKTIIECYNSGLRCLLFVTGKGLYKSRNTENINKPKLYHSVIRSAFVQWAKSNKLSRYVLSFEKASIEHGGDGAFYVYLRKKK